MQGKKVLVVEPNPDILSVIVFFLAENEARAGCLNDPARTIDMITTEHFNAVIIDLPFLNYDEDLAFLREVLDAACEIPVVVISTRKSMELIARIMAAGAKGYFHKPFSMKALMGRINQLFDGATSSAA